ncbi:PREDICTED: tetraspanin-13 [Cyphomyrmex costatus]|uniref:tetraspanin-13 n=1 Tax=Cyphomyrmex costatus TaxID=456900 RepID=UPI0008523593|nr:PREDICTED: tetraspanin-13 [Cyphomyrmex costatus]XP_018401409.1 PREDICTED: tetraspanin-13 [Cyphomyrmex costatus]
MCGGFTCSKNALTALNILYIVVAFILIGVAVYGRASALVTNLPIIGGILACGVILFLISILGLIGAVKHHQVLLFFYMLILFLLFLIQFSIACACLAVNTKQQEQLAEQGWRRVGPDLRAKVQTTFNCCGFNSTTDESGGPCEVNKICCPSIDVSQMPCTSCPPCMHKLQSTIDYAFKLCGSIGLFFSFTEVIAAFLARRYRNQLDPQEKAARAIFPQHDYLY